MSPPFFLPLKNDAQFPQRYKSTQIINKFAIDWIQLNLFLLGQV